MDTRREFIKKAAALSAGAGLLNVLPPAIQRALAIDPAPGSTWLDAEHIVFLMQENRSFDHTYGTLQGVRGYNDPRAITLPDKNLVWLQSNAKGETFTPFHLDIKGTNATWMHSLPHTWSNQTDARNNGKYDKWLEAKRSDHKEYADMPLTMGYYTREDIPFYYALADAFTVGDQHFCSSLTGTTPNRLFFWTGTIRDQQYEQSQANVWNEDVDYERWARWTSFPERLEENGVSWKVYQNELSVGVGFEGEEEGWLANFGDNPLELFKQYRVKLSAEYIANLPKESVQLADAVKKEEQLLPTLAAGSEEAKKSAAKLAALKRYQLVVEADQKNYTREKYDQLSQHDKNIHDKAFSTNKKDPNYRQLDTLKYKDGKTSREVKVPKGDILHQFREDVKTGQLPTVSWLVAPENFSDHPVAAWYGAWYISEVMDILTKNPEVWKKTIFILTYDENDGYFDHVPPFVAPHPHKTGTGKVSDPINTAVDYVSGPEQQSKKDHEREGPIGLGYRVPLVVASPWSRGGWVCSEVFDHTSSLQMLEKFLLKKTGKQIRESNISDWRRTICGDLSSVFRPWNGEPVTAPTPLERDAFIESIHKAKFKDAPSNFKPLTAEEIAAVNQHPQQSPLVPVQEKGIRPSCALPYELYAECRLNADKQSVSVVMTSSNQIFGAASLGAPFNVYVPGVYQGEAVQARSYAVTAGDALKDNWTISDFENGQYQLRVYGPNGFYREFKGSAQDPSVEINCYYERNKTAGIELTGNILLNIGATGTPVPEIEITDNAYKTPLRTQVLDAKKQTVLVLDLSNSYGWYDFTVRVKGQPLFERRYAGRVETGRDAKTDPAMGQVI
ncbi:MAG TPA: phospholipase C, phosphocholine-specific [Chitinophagaceae bacterium]|jgi:phospholipase C